MRNLILLAIMTGGCTVVIDSDRSGTDTGGPDCGECSPRDCGPELGMPNWLCDDGVTVAGPGDCVADEAGACAWEIVECPDAVPTDCQPEECGPQPEVEMICPSDESVVFECSSSGGDCGWTWYCPET